MVKKRKVKAKAKRTKRSARKAVKRPKAGKARARKPAAKKAKPSARKTPESTHEKIGKVTHYFPQVKAGAVMMLKNSLKVGDEIYIKGHTTDFKEKVNSIQLDRVPIQEGRKGQEIGLLVKSRVRIGDSVYRI